MTPLTVQQRELAERLIATADPSSNTDTGDAVAAARELVEVARLDGNAELATEASVWVCIHLMRSGRLDEAIDASHDVRDELRGELPGTRLGDARLELLRTVALAGSEASRFDVAIGAAQELAGDSDVHVHADAAFDAAFSLAICLERMGNSWQALRVLGDVLARHGTAEPSFARLYTLNAVVATAVGAFHRVREIDPHGEAIDLLITARDAAERAVPLLDRYSNPLYRATLTGNLGEILIYQGELDAADRHLRGALEGAERIGAIGHQHRIRASIGAWLVADGRPAEALDHLEALLDELGHDGPLSTRVRAHHTAHLAARHIGDFERALDHLTHYELLERRRTTSQLRSQSEMFVTRTEAQAEVERHRFSAERDPLTGLGNRRRLSRILAELAPTDGPVTPFTLAMVDVDHFKAVNDELGHAVGDAVLVQLGDILLADRDDDRHDVVRYGGEEIVIVMRGLDVDGAVVRCDSLRRRIERHEWSGLPDHSRITVSIGIAGAPPCHPDRVIGAADRAMYTAKRSGRNQVCAATDDDVRDATPVSIPRH